MKVRQGYIGKLSVEKRGGAHLRCTLASRLINCLLTCRIIIRLLTVLMAIWARVTAYLCRSHPNGIPTVLLMDTEPLPLQRIPGFKPGGTQWKQIEMSTRHEKQSIQR